jgi:hypothetical protein
MGTTYIVIQSPKVMDDEGNLCDGLCDVTEKTIEICQFQTRESKQQAFIHELIHAVLWEIGASRRLGEDLEDVIADGLSKFLIKTYKMRAVKSKVT